jgi:hypothetical protein
MFGKISWTRLAGAAAVLVALPAAPFLPGWAALSVLAVIVATLNVWEAARVRAGTVATAAAG